MRACTCSTARHAHAEGRPSAGEPANRPADDILEELEPRQRMFKVFSRSEKREHGDLRAAQKRVRQPRAWGAAG